MVNDMKIAAVLNTNPQYDPASARECLHCHHAVPHDRSDEYEDPTRRCSLEKTHHETGYDCGHKRYSKRCDDASGGADGKCYTYTTAPCDCSEDDRLIAELRAIIAALRLASKCAKLVSG